MQISPKPTCRDFSASAEMYHVTDMATFSSESVVNKSVVVMSIAVMSYDACLEVRGEIIRTVL